MNGIDAVRSACRRVVSSRIDAQFSRRALIFSMLLIRLRWRAAAPAADAVHPAREASATAVLPAP
jgi:hypothetical protein